jgi:hypothetical protein
MNDTTFAAPGMPEEILAQAPTPPDDPKMIYDIRISRRANGYAVTVGCKDFVFESQDKMMSHINAYLHNPTTVTYKYQKGTLFIES